MLSSLLACCLVAVVVSGSAVEASGLLGGFSSVLALSLLAVMALTGLGLFLFQSEIHFSRRQRIVQKFIEFSNVENITKKARYTLKDKEIASKQVSIEIEQDQLSLLKNSKATFLQKGFFSASDNKVSGTLAYKNDRYDIDLSLTGSWKDYRKNANAQSYIYKGY